MLEPRRGRSEKVTPGRPNGPQVSLPTPIPSQLDVRGFLRRMSTRLHLLAMAGGNVAVVPALLVSALLGTACGVCVGGGGGAERALKGRIVV